MHEVGARDQLTHLLLEREADRDPRLRAVGLHRQADADAHDLEPVHHFARRSAGRFGDVAGHHHHLMAATYQAAPEMMHMLGDATRVRVIELGDEDDSHDGTVRDPASRTPSWGKLDKTRQIFAPNAGGPLDAAGASATFPGTAGGRRRRTYAAWCQSFNM